MCAGRCPGSTPLNCKLRLVPLLPSQLSLFVMSSIKPITSYFKVRSKDELEVEELLLSQVSRHSSLEHALTISTVSSAVMSIVVDLSNDDSVSAGGYLKEALMMKLMMIE